MEKQIIEVLQKYQKENLTTLNAAKILLNLFSVSKCQHPYKKVISGDDGMYCTECNKYITTF
jgi:hypothetical protein